MAGVVFVEVSVAVLGLALVTLVVTTAVGSRRRGARGILPVLAGIVFPLTWVVWYLRDLPPREAGGPGRRRGLAWRT